MVLSNASFEYVRTLLRERSGHSLEEDKGYLVETRLLPVARRHGFASVEELVLRLRARSNEALLAESMEVLRSRLDAAVQLGVARGAGSV